MTGPEREAVVSQLFPLVRVIAHRVARACRLADEDDLIGDGALGLVRAVDNYDPTRGVALDKYVRHVVLGSMLNGLRRKDPVSERARRRVRQAERVRSELELRLTSVSDNELDDVVPGFQRALAQVECGLPLSLDAPLPYGTRVGADWSGDPARIFESLARRQRVRAAVAQLPPRQREIVLHHYFGENSLRSLSQRMAVTPQRISQLHCAALNRLRIIVRSNA
ncbi:MAG: sigma-70 family RNA polymerase sigma factor [Vulcanimicrobiaceae bacterium]